MSKSVDVRSHRKNRNYSVKTLVFRVCWGLAMPLFRFSPRLLYSWRNLLLRLFGAKLGHRVRVYPTANVFFPWNLEIGDDVTIGWNVELYSLGKISIGSGTIISQHAHLCAGSHDITQPNLPLITPPIVIGSGVWICSGAFVGPGKTIGENSIVGARSCVFNDVPQNTIVGGNPARVIKPRFNECERSNEELGE